MCPCVHNLNKGRRVDKPRQQNGKHSGDKIEKKANSVDPDEAARLSWISTVYKTVFWYVGLKWLNEGYTGSIQFAVPHFYFCCTEGYLS